MSHVNRRSVFVVVTTVLASLTLISPPARAISVGFNQVDWGDGNGGFQDQNSQWGQAIIGLDATDAGALASDGGGGFYGYVNIVTAVGGGSNNNWAVQNMLVDYASLSDLNGGQGATGINFDLGQTDGTSVSSLNYSLTLTSAPLTLEPSGPLTNTVTLTHALEVEGNSDDPTMPGDEAEQPAMDYVGAAAGTAPSRAGTGRISTNETSIPRVSESLNGCAPGSAARSLAYLAQIGAINLTNSAQSIYAGLTNSMGVRPGLGTEGISGTNSQFARGKNSYIASNGLNVANTAFTNTPLFAGFFGLGTNSGSFAGAISTLRSNGDVEVYLSWGQRFVRTNAAPNPPLGTNVVYGAHQAFVTGLIPNTNAAGQIVSYTLRYIDDHQQNGNGTNFFNEMTILPNGRDASTTNTTIVFRGVVGFFMENVTQVPEPGSLAMVLLGFGAVGLPLFFIRRPKRPRT